MSDQLPAQDQSNLSEIDARLQAIQARADLVKLQNDQNSLAPGQLVPAPPVEEVELFAWVSDNRVFDPKSSQWFVRIFVIGVLAVVALALLKEVMLILLVATLIFVYYALARVQPVKVEHIIFNTGIKSAGRMYTWRELRSFWVYNKVDTSILRLDTKKNFPHTLEILLDGDSQEVKQLLSRYIPLHEAPLPDSNKPGLSTTTLTQRIPYQAKVVDWVEHHI